MIKKSIAMIIMLIIVGGLFGGVYFFKELKTKLVGEYIKTNLRPVPTVSATKAKKASWSKRLQATGSLRAVKGVNVTTELSGMVREILFSPGAEIQKGQVLVKLDIKPELEKLRRLKAERRLAKITFERDLKQLSFGAVSQQTVDDDEANYASLKAQVLEQKATIAKKVVRAPFSGRLGIRLVNVGQFINPGDAIVTLQTLNPIYVDFFLPQQQLAKVRLGQEINMTLDEKGKVYHGKVTTINPVVDKDIRNFEVEATLNNANYDLLPGMFSEVNFTFGKSQQYITLPLLAVSFNPYGSVVFLLHKTNEKYKGHQLWRAEQRFIVTGDERGNQVAILKGIKEGDLVVTSGQLKLRNGSLTAVNNSVEPSDNPNPHPPEYS